VELAFQGHAVRHAVVEAVAGLAHGGVDQREQRAAVQLAVQVAQAVVHAQSEYGLAVPDLVDLQAEQAAEGAGIAHRLDLNAHLISSTAWRWRTAPPWRCWPVPVCPEAHEIGRASCRERV